MSALPPVASGISGRRSRRRGAVAACALAQFMVVLDVSIVNVALPQLTDGPPLLLAALVMEARIVGAAPQDG